MTECSIHDLVDALSAEDTRMIIIRLRTLEEHAEAVLKANQGDKANLVDAILNLHEAVKLLVCTQGRHEEAIKALIHGKPVDALYGLRGAVQDDG